MRRRPDPARIDLLLATVLLAWVELQALLSAATSGVRLVTAVVGAAVTGSVALRRRFPAAVGLGVQASLVVTGLFVRLPAGAVTIAWFCALYALTVWTSSVMFAVGQTFFVVSNLLPELHDHSNIASVMPFTVGGVVVMILLRIVVAGRDRRLAVVAREHDLNTREAIVNERARIARELHDMIAHHVSIMVVQAGAERRVLDGDHASTREVLTVIERIGRSALADMRRLVGMLRSDERDALAPQPGVSDIPTLVSQMREAGLPVELCIEGQPRELPVGLDLSAYRIVQEGLTNALTHAGTAPTTVLLRHGNDSIEIEIVDAGGGTDLAVGGGLGLIGIRERVTLYGGTLDAGPRPHGGFAVRVLLPIR